MSYHQPYILMTCLDQKIACIDGRSLLLME